MMTFEKALEFLNTFINNEKITGSYTSTHYDPGRVANMLHRAGLDINKIKYIHIAGTKGKGSTAHYISKILENSGPFRVGLYTSPHAVRINERISINSEPISDLKFAEEVSRFRENYSSLTASVKPTYFDILTYLAMAYFINTSCDFAVLETGLGGRLDSTNFCIPAVSVITSIGFDHTAILGNTLGEIAGEKAGIIKKNIPVVSSYLEPEALARIKEEARLKGSPFYYFPECVSYRVKGRSERGSTFSASIHNCGTGMELNDACLSQPGDVFLENFLLSLMALTAAGMPFSEKGILEAAWSRIPFRMEKRGDILIDVAHNDSSLECLFKTVRDYFKPLKTNLHVGILKDKELTRISKKIFEYESMFSKIVLFDFPTPRGSGGRALFESLRALPQVKYSGEFPEILHEDGVLNVFTGSFQIIDRILDQISADRYEYSSFLNESLDIPEWEKIYTEAVNQKIPALRPFSCKFLYFLVKIARPEKILEIGTGSGYSTLWIARGLSGKAVLISLERDRKRFDLASKLFRDNPRVRVLHRDAFKYLGENSDIYDFVFLDAQKRDYLSYLELLKSRIKTGGILVADNFLLGGLTASLPELKKEKYQGGVRLLRAFNYELSRGGSFETLFVSIEDGLTIALKK